MPLAKYGRSALPKAKANNMLAGDACGESEREGRQSFSIENNTSRK